ncbi:hypothetical protein EDB85DRAFT_1890351 [Lactarius pseudohatsudake]|nr:hypothetical protein EDB85DRAFT_1890351 [Lactarius pseudohatsudake]
MPENSVALFRLGYQFSDAQARAWYGPNWNGGDQQETKDQIRYQELLSMRVQILLPGIPTCSPAILAAPAFAVFEMRTARYQILHKATTLPLLPIISRICAYLIPITRDPRQSSTVFVQFILSGVAGVTSHLASQVHTVARNTHSITLAVCALPVPFKNVFCAGISNGLLSPLNPSVDKSLSWHPFLINEDIHGPAVDFAIRKTTNATSVVLALLKDFLQHAWASELSSGSHVALVKTVIDEMLLEHDAIFAKLQADLHPGLLSRLVAFNWAHRSKQATWKHSLSLRILQPPTRVTLSCMAILYIMASASWNPSPWRYQVCWLLKARL